jgi:hypothetical protein
MQSKEEQKRGMIASKPFPVTRAKEDNDFSHALLRKV